MANPAREWRCTLEKANVTKRHKRECMAIHETSYRTDNNHKAKSTNVCLALMSRCAPMSVLLPKSLTATWTLSLMPG